MVGRRLSHLTARIHRAHSVSTFPSRLGSTSPLCRYAKSTVLASPLSQVHRDKLRRSPDLLDQQASIMRRNFSPAVTSARSISERSARLPRPAVKRNVEVNDFSVEVIFIINGNAPVSTLSISSVCRYRIRSLEPENDQFLKLQIVYFETSFAKWFETPVSPAIPPRKTIDFFLTGQRRNVELLL